MKDQISRMPISLQGIDRRPQDSTPDGSLLNLLNMRLSNGAYRPIPEKSLMESSFLKYLYKHVISDSVYAWWGINDVEDPYAHSFLAYIVYVDGVATYTDSTFLSITLETGTLKDFDFAPLGNSLVISDLYQELTMVMLFQPDTNTYRQFNDLLPRMPYIDFQRLANTADDELKSLWTLFSGGDTKEYMWNYMTTAIAGTSQAMWADRASKGYLTGKFLIRAAWELFDGTIVMHSIPSFIAISEIDGRLAFDEDYSAGDPAFNSYVRFTGYDLQCKINISSSDLTALKAQYKTVVKSLNFYITNSRALEDIDISSYTLADWDTGYVSLHDKKGDTSDSVRKWVTDEMLYFVLIKKNIDDLVAETWSNLSIGDASLISSGETITPTPLSVHKIFGKRLFAYNNRIFFGNVKNTLSMGTSLRGLLFPGEWWCTGPAYYIGFSYDLDTKDGTRRAFSGWQSCNYYRGQSTESTTNADIHTPTTIGKTGKTWTTNQWVGYTVAITSGTGSGASAVRTIVSNDATTLTVDSAWDIEPQNDSDFAILVYDYMQFVIYDMLGYPDQRAKRLDIWHNDGVTTTRHLHTLSLTPVYGMNFSFVIPQEQLAGLFNGGAQVKQTTSDWSVEAVNANSTYWDSNRIQATEFENPFYFPAINSYRVEDIVLGMATNAVPLSQGQFGQFPIYVFTGKGIWVLNIANGDILIDSIRPLSAVVCTIPQTILGIDGGVIFMSNEGLMILTGRDPISISDKLMGRNISALSGMIEYERVINDPNTYQPKAFLDEVDFETYAAAARIAFVVVNTQFGPEKEIIVSNPAYNYSYVYNLVSRVWTIITQSWDIFIRDYPKSFGAKYIELGVNDIYDLTQERLDPNLTYPIMVHIETMPIKFGEVLSFKKILRSLLYGWIHPQSQHPFTFYLFGTTNGRDWFVLSASNVMTAEDTVAIGRSSFSCRSYIMVLGGSVHDDSYISGLIADIEKRYNSKLL